MYDLVLYRSLKVCNKSLVTHNTQTHKSKSNCCNRNINPIHSDIKYYMLLSVGIYCN